jgi:hypothetical protein
MEQPTCESARDVQDNFVILLVLDRAGDVLKHGEQTVDSLPSKHHAIFNLKAD